MSKKLFLVLVPFLVFGMSACQRGNGGTSSAGGSSKDSGTSSQSSQAGDSSADDSSADDSSTDDSSESGEGFTIYFKDVEWWNNYAAATYISVDGGEAVAMTYDTVHGYDPVGKFNYWSYQLGADATKVVFQRWGTNTSTQETSYWGAKTVEVTLSERGEYNMYDISGTEAAWEDQSHFAEGTWGTYPAE